MKTFYIFIFNLILPLSCIAKVDTLSTTLYVEFCSFSNDSEFSVCGVGEQPYRLFPFMVKLDSKNLKKAYEIVFSIYNPQLGGNNSTMIDDANKRYDFIKVNIENKNKYFIQNKNFENKIKYLNQKNKTKFKFNGFLFYKLKITFTYKIVENKTILIPNIVGNRKSSLFSYTNSKIIYIDEILNVE